MRAFLDECDDIGGESAVCVTEEEERNVNVTMKVEGNQRGGSRLQAVAASSFQRVATTWQLLWLWRTLCPASGIDISQLLLLQAKRRKGEKEMGGMSFKALQRNRNQPAVQRERDECGTLQLTQKDAKENPSCNFLKSELMKPLNKVLVGVACKKAYNICIYIAVYIFIFAAKNKKIFEYNLNTTNTPWKVFAFG